MNDYVFQPSSVLTFETVQADSQRLSALLKNHADVSTIRFDLSKVTHCDSTGLALFIEAKRACKQQNIAFSMENIPESIDSLAQFCGVDVVLE